MISPQGCPRLARVKLELSEEIKLASYFQLAAEMTEIKRASQ